MIFKDEYKWLKPEEIKNKIEEKEEQEHRLCMEVVALAALTPQIERDCEGNEFALMHSVVKNVMDVLNDLREVHEELYKLRTIEENEKLDNMPSEFEFEKLNDWE